ncbi:hypothetical protein P3W45_000709 [Vairimorpha bombi]|jgi:hypothetical protein
MRNARSLENNITNNNENKDETKHNSELSIFSLDTPKYTENILASKEALTTESSNSQNIAHENFNLMSYCKNKINISGFKKTMLFNFMGESRMSDHIIKLDYYSKKNKETTYDNFSELSDKYSINFCNMGCDTNTKCCHNRKFYSPYDEMYSMEIKVISILTEYVIDLKYLFAKRKLDNNEIEIFEKIIYWMRLLIKDLSNNEKEILFNRLSNEFFDLGFSYLVVISFLKDFFIVKDD